MVVNRLYMLIIMAIATAASDAATAITKQAEEHSFKLMRIEIPVESQKVDIY